MPCSRGSVSKRPVTKCLLSCGVRPHPFASAPLLLAFAIVLLARAAAAERPPDGTPAPKLLEGSDGTPDMLPLPYIGTSVSALVVSLDASAVREYNGEDKDQIRLDIEGQGPVHFSLPRWNQGDYAPRLQPRRPFSQPNLGRIMEGMMGSAEEDPASIPTQAWRPSIEKGVILGSVAQNGRQWNDTSGLFYGTVACVYASHGFGYSMDNGEFSNQNPNIDIAIGKLGISLEANVDAAIAWFPYHQGWLAGYVDTPGEYNAASAKNKWTASWSFSPSLPEDAAKVVQWDGDGALLSLPGVDAAEDGMLFLTSTNPGPGNNDVNVVSTYVDGRKWRVQVREDDQPIMTIFCNPDQAMFAFVYVPYSAGGLIGGLISGSTGAPQVSRGGFSSVRISEGVYHLDILRYPGLDFFHQSQPLSNRDGMLLLQVVGHEAGNHKFSKHAVLSYEILPNGTVRVECHRLQRGPGGAAKDEAYPATDSDFYFAWVDFRTPLTPTPTTFQGRIHGAVGPTLTFRDGLSAGLGLMLLMFVLGLALLFVATRLSARNSLLALAPLSHPRGPRGPLEEEGGYTAADAVGGLLPGSGAPGQDSGMLQQLLPQGVRDSLGKRWGMAAGSRAGGEPRVDLAGEREKDVEGAPERLPDQGALLAHVTEHKQGTAHHK